MLQSRNAKNVNCCHNISKSESINLLRIPFLKVGGIYKKYCPNFHSIQCSFFLLFCFAIFEMVDSKYSTDNYKSRKIIIGTVMKYPKMLKLIPGHLKTKTPLAIRYVPHQYKIQRLKQYLVGFYDPKNLFCVIT